MEALERRASLVVPIMDTAHLLVHMSQDSKDGSQLRGEAMKGVQDDVSRPRSGLVLS